MSPISGGIDVITGEPSGKRQPGARRQVLSREKAGGSNGHQGDAGIHHRQIDPLSFAGAFPRHERRENCDYGKESAAEIRYLDGGEDWISRTIRLKPENAGKGEVIHVVPSASPERSVLAVSADGTEYQAALTGAERLVTEAQAIHDAGSKPFQHHIGNRNELVKYLRAF